jgi:hypothetical protein
MAFSNGPVVVTNGLVLALDAADRNSYPGSGTTWFDLSGRGNNGTLTNGPTFNNINGGTIVFDGTNDYVDIPTLNSSAAIDFNTSTIIYVARATSTFNARNTIFSQYYTGTGAQMEFSNDTNNFYLRSNFRQNSAGTPELEAPNGTNQILADQFYHITVTYGSKTIEHFKNGVSLGSATNATQTNINGVGSVNLGRNSQGAGSLYLKGNISLVLIYNRVLTTTEILQNYNAVKSRFGL